ncbi:hypothetical protein BGZ99_004608 [Dissophora globulifera]|uniref:General transcription and DNA repair factor IIH n=1 Tax=Dissophora globulifera TaxID=979702 RepID=A0A9P6UZW5_9FUNG|nr:hypothetical protein BGZ99_004608 [Dissophora globulifera]
MGKHTEQREQKAEATTFMATNGRRQVEKDDDDFVDVDDSSLQTNQANYAWEEEYKRSWDVLQEDEHGSLAGVVNSLQKAAKRKRQLRDTDPIQRGIIRHLFILIDLSNAMQEKDLRPSRLSLTFTYLEAFIAEYFDQNPISQIGLIGTKDGLAEKLTELSGNPTDHIKALKMKKFMETGGEPSLQNALELARNSLIHVPAHGSREILVIMGSLTTTDPGNIHDTIARLMQDNIRASVIALAAEVQVLKFLSTQTKGTFGVAMNEGHYRDLLFEVIPPTAITTTKASANLVQMGFPARCNDSAATLCACHGKLTLGGYKCPQCGSKLCDIPTECDICNLTLVSSPLLARSYHHLFPVENFVEVPWKDAAMTTACFSCQKTFLSPHKVSVQLQSTTDAGRYQCKLCEKTFCTDCDVFIHDVLHNCPGCLSQPRRRAGGVIA